MSRSSLIQMLTLGFAIFAMFFGAGNVVFPLVVGMETTADFPYALAGLFVTAVVVPFAGLYVAVLLDGCYRRFFTPLGRWGGALVAATILALLGPFGVIPRCIALSQATFQMYFSFGPPWVFDALACGVVFILALRPTAIVNILGKYLTPLMIAILTMIIIIGLMQAPVAQQQASITGYYAWSQGLTQGYQTMDLLAALFFASFVAGWLKQAQESSGPALWLVACGAMLIAGSLLTLVYGGFGLLAASYAPQLVAVPPAEMLGAIAALVLGPYAGLTVCLAVCLACITTALSLAGIFANYLSVDILPGYLSYPSALFVTMLVTFAFSTLQFEGIVGFLAPILEFVYPWLIALTVYNAYANTLKNRFVEIQSGEIAME